MEMTVWQHSAHAYSGTIMPFIRVALTSFLLGARLSLSNSLPSISTPWDISSYCNAPHVNVTHYEIPAEGEELVHLSIMMRHHKVRELVHLVT